MVKRNRGKSPVSWEEVDLNENNRVLFFPRVYVVYTDRSAIIIYASAVLSVFPIPLWGTLESLSNLQSTSFKINDRAHKPYPLKYTTLKQATNYGDSF